MFWLKILVMNNQTNMNIIYISWVELVCRYGEHLVINWSAGWGRTKRTPIDFNKEDKSICYTVFNNDTELIFIHS